MRVLWPFLIFCDFCGSRKKSQKNRTQLFVFLCSAHGAYNVCKLCTLHLKNNYGVVRLRTS